MTEQTTIELNGAIVQIKVNDAGVVTTKTLGPEEGFHAIENPDGDELPVHVSDDQIDIMFGKGSVYIPHDDGTIPRVIGRMGLPGWLLGQLRLLGFDYADEYGWSDDNEAPWTPIQHDN